MIVVDASAILELLLNSPVGERVAQRVFAPNQSLHAPHLIDLEICQVLRRYARNRELSETRARQSLEDFLDLPLQRYPGTAFIPRIWRLRASVTAYDAAYLCLAEALNAPLLTCDAKLRRAHGHDAVVVLP